MKLAVISCWNYRDCWNPFFALLKRFWPDAPEAYLLTDAPDGAIFPASARVVRDSGQGLSSWGPRVAAFAGQQTEPVLLVQEDFFLSAPVNADLIRLALVEMEIRGAHALRLYPCPGADFDYGNEHFGIVSRQSEYRVSCQATIWRPGTLAKLAMLFRTPSDFELGGTAYLAGAPSSLVLATKREAQRWPLEYLCSAVNRGKWDPNAKKLCDANGIKGDWTMRPTAA